jgi:hypothetical protein
VVKQRGYPPLCLALIDFLSLQIEKPNIFICLRKGCIDFAQIISSLFLIVESFWLVEDILSLRICG